MRSYQREEAKCNLCYNWFAIQSHAQKGCLNICQECFEKALHTKCFKVQNRGNLYQLYLIKKISANQQTNTATLNMQESNTVLQELDAWRQSEMDVDRVKWNQLEKCMKEASLSKYNLTKMLSLLNYSKQLAFNTEKQQIQQFINKIHLINQEFNADLQEKNTIISNQNEQIHEIKGTTGSVIKNKALKNIKNINEKTPLKEIVINNNLINSRNCKELKGSGKHKQMIDNKQNSANKISCFSQISLKKSLIYECHSDKEESMMKNNGSIYTALNNKKADLNAIKVSTFSLYESNTSSKQHNNESNTSSKQQNNESSTSNKQHNRSAVKCNKLEESDCKLINSEYNLKSQQQKQKIEQYLQQHSKVPQVLSKIMTEKIYSAVRNTNTLNNCLQLVSYSIEDIDMLCYLHSLQWKDVTIFKLIKVHLTDDNLAILLSFLQNTKIETLVLTNNYLTQQSLLLLHISLQGKSSLKKVYLGNNMILQIKSKNQIKEIRDRCMLFL